MADAKGEMPEKELTDAVESETQSSQPEPAKKQETDTGATPSQSPADLQKELEAKEKVIANLRKNEDQAKKDAKRLKELEALEQKRQEDAMSEAEKVQARIKVLEDEKAQLLKDKQESERRELAREVAKEIGLPEGLARKIAGDTRDEMVEDANAMLELLPKQEADKRPIPPRLTPTNPGDGAKGETQAQKKARLLGTRENPWGADDAAVRGGGVVVSDKD